jgi:AraC family transcriptional regulator, positive regulator of tynA and feaB
MPQCSESLSTPELDYEGWREALRPQWGRYNPVVMEPKTFTGRACLQRLCGLIAVELSCNAHHVERTQHDVRSDGVDHYCVCFQVAGESTIIQNDRVVQLAVGDAAFVDSARPGTYVSRDGCGRWLSLHSNGKS